MGSFDDLYALVLVRPGRKDHNWASCKGVCGPAQVCKDGIVSDQDGKDEARLRTVSEAASSAMAPSAAASYGRGTLMMLESLAFPVEFYSLTTGTCLAIWS